MARTPGILPHIGGLPDLIERDIRERGLRPGDRYLTAQQVGRLFGVSTMTANRAMQKLATRKIVSRSQRAGTFVGENHKPPVPSSLRCVHLLVPSEYFRLDQPVFDLTVSGIHAELPDDAIQFSFVPVQGDLAFVQQLVEKARSAGTLGGLVLFLSSPQVQRYVSESRVPAVVSGSVYPEVGNLCWMDRDQRQVGRLLAASAVLRRHRRLAVLMRERWGFGDNLMIDGIHEALGEARAGADPLIVRSLPSDPELISGAVRQLLSAKNRPTALICRSPMAADAVASTVAQMGLSDPGRTQIFLAEYYPGRVEEARFVYARPRIDPREQGILLARMLRSLAGGSRPEPDHHLIPVDIVAPGEDR